MKKYLVIVYLLFSIGFNHIAFSQISPFSKVINDLNTDGIQTYASCQNNIGSTFLVGSVMYGEGLIYKLDKNGELLWSKTWDLPDYEDDIYFNNIIPTNDNHYFIAGWFYLPQGRQCVFSKINENGDTLWTKSNNLGIPTSSFQTSDDGYIILGYQAANLPVLRIISIVKVDEFGNQEWSKSLTINNKPCVGYSIKQIQNGNFIIVGKFRNEESNVEKGFISELSNMGDLIWSKSLNIYNNNIDDCDAHDFQIINDSVYILLNGPKSIILKTDLSGNIAWAKQINGTSGFSSNWYSIRKLRKSDNNDKLLFVSGNEFSDYSVIDLEANVLLSGWLEINALDIFLTEENGILVMGNGPLIGVKKDVWRYNTGLIQMDETGYGVECIENTDNNSSNRTITSYDIDFEELSGCEPISYAIELVDIDLSISEGCVDFIGAAQSLSNDFVQILPNPNNGTFNFSTKGSREGVLLIINTLGQVIFTGRISETITSININPIDNGIYFYKFENENRQEYTGRMIIQN